MILTIGVFALLLPQQPVTKTIPDILVCGTCRVEFVKVGSVTSGERDPDLMDGIRLARNSRGQWDGANSKVFSAGEVVPRGQVPPPPIDPALIAAMEPTTGWLHEDANSLIWVSVMSRRGGGPLTPTVEVLDPARGELLAAAQLPPLFRSVGAGYWSSRKQSSAGYFSFDIWQMVLRRN